MTTSYYNVLNDAHLVDRSYFDLASSFEFYDMLYLCDNNDNTVNRFLDTNEMESTCSVTATIDADCSDYQLEIRNEISAHSRLSE